MERKPWLQATGDYWNKQRMKALVRDGFKCQFQTLGLQSIKGVCTCEAQEDRLRALQVHHIIERTNFRPHEIEGHDLDNLITVCQAHHEHIHPHMRYMRGMPSKDGGEYPDKEL